jgi:hypothetical protein
MHLVVVIDDWNFVSAQSSKLKVCPKKRKIGVIVLVTKTGLFVVGFWVLHLTPAGDKEK